jgi:hypothetical protein
MSVAAPNEPSVDEIAIENPGESGFLGTEGIYKKRIEVEFTGTISDYIGDGVVATVDGALFDNAPCVIHSIIVRSAASRCPFPIMIVANGKEGPIPYLNKYIYSATDSKRRGMFSLGPKQQFHAGVGHGICVASFAQLDRSDLEMLQFYGPGVTIQHVQEGTVPSKEWILVPRHNPIICELMCNKAYREQLLEQRRIGLVDKGVYYKLSPSAFCEGGKCVKARLLKSPEVDMGALQFNIHACLGKTKVNFKPSVDEIASGALTLEIEYRPILKTEVVKTKKSKATAKQEEAVVVSSEEEED